MIKLTHDVCGTVILGGAPTNTNILYYKEQYFAGTGVPLQVILHSFCKKDIIWFSMIYGEWDDNVLLLGLNREKAERLAKENYEIASPMAEAFGSGDAFEEYVLSSKVQQELGVSLDPKDSTYSISREQDIQYEIYIHDDCFSYVEPTDKNLLRDLVDSILQQHSYYLQTEVDWSSVIDFIVQELLKCTSIKIKSHLRKKSLSIRPENWDNTRFFAFWDDIKNLLFPRTKCTISVKDGKAVLVKQ